MTTSTRKKLSPGRLRCMQALAVGALKMTPADKTKLVGQYFPGKTSFGELANAEADKIIDEMKLLAGQTPTRPQPRSRLQARAGVETGDVALLITPPQRERLAELTRELIAAEISSNYIAAVRERACGRPSPVRAQEAEKAIEALKALSDRVKGGWKPTSGAPA